MVSQMKIPTSALDVCVLCSTHRFFQLMTLAGSMSVLIKSMTMHTHSAHHQQQLPCGSQRTAMEQACT